MIPADLTTEQILTFILAFVRITVMIGLLPIFSSRNIPVQLKAGFSFLLAIILFPFVQIDLESTFNFTIPIFVFMMIKEVFIGITIGFAASLLFAAVQFAGRLIDRQMGFALVQLVDPFTDAASTVSGQFQIIIFTIIFLLINGHYFLILAIQKSFDVIPIFHAQMPSGKMAAFLTTMVADIFVLAVKLSAPVFTVLLLTTVSLGVVARTVPQINIFFVGLPLKIGVGVITLIIALPALSLIFQGMVDALMRDIWKLLYLMV